MGGVLKSPFFRCAGIKGGIGVSFFICGISILASKKASFPHGAILALQMNYTM